MTELERVDAWWRAANYLSAAQLYLLDNPLLWRALRRDVRRIHSELLKKKYCLNSWTSELLNS